MGKSAKRSGGNRHFRIPIAIELFILLWLFTAMLVALTAWPLLVYLREVKVNRTRDDLIRTGRAIARITMARGFTSDSEEADRLLPILKSIKEAQPSVHSILVVGKNGGDLRPVVALNRIDTIDVSSLERFLTCIERQRPHYYSRNGRPYVVAPIMDGGVPVGVVEASANDNGPKISLGFWVATGLSLLISLGLTALGALLIGHRYLAPVRSLKRAARKVAQGDFDYKIPMSTRVEMNDMAVTFNTMITTLRASQEKLLLIANTDPMTGLYTRRYFDQRLGYEVERARRYAHKLALLMIDIDNFKAINSQYGHSAGDEILAKVGELIIQSLRNLDVVGRYGGEEFAVILPETSPEQARVIAERIRISCQDSVFTIGNGEDEITLTLSLGISAFPIPCSSIKELISGADRALYRAKDMGRNEICGFDPEIDRTRVATPHQVSRYQEEINDRATEVLATAVGVKDGYTQGHSARVTEYALQLALKLNLSSEDRRSLRIAGLLHDVGKTGIPDEILNKPGALTQRERDIILTHPSVGGYIVRQTIQNDDVISAIVYHHERWDGGGYPEGLKGDRIPMLARVLAIADVFDALTSDRPYREALPVDAAVEEIYRNAGTQFDPEMVQAFVECARRNKAFNALNL